MDAKPQVLEALTTNFSGAWWSFALRGALAVIFGIIAIVNPGAAAGAFVIIFASYAVLDGILELALAKKLGRAGQRWGWYLFEGLASIAVGVIAFAFPKLTLLALVLLIGIRAIVQGIFEVVGAFTWEGVDSRWLLGLTGVVSVVFGGLILSRPATGAVALIWIIGVYAIIFGVMLFGLGMHLLNLQRHEPKLREPAATAT